LKYKKEVIEEFGHFIGQYWSRLGNQGRNNDPLIT
jgi:hypothetical protein